MGEQRKNAAGQAAHAAARQAAAAAAAAKRTAQAAASAVSAKAVAIACAIGGVVAVALVVLVSLLAAVQAASTPPCGRAQAQAASVPAGVSARGTREIPRRLISIYQAAASKYHLGADGWAYLAAINRIETDFGHNLSTSSAGAVGWMQFMPSTWASYGVDADHNGKRNPNSPVDAIYTAARYLKAGGAPGSWQHAIFSYNHAQWYVDDVVAHAHAYTAPGQGAASGGRVLVSAPAAPAAGMRVRLRLQGRATTYGWDPVIHYVDPQDNNKPSLGGATNDRPGIAVYNQHTLGGWWTVQAPGGAWAILQQTDIGPAPGTGNILDVNAVAARTIFGVTAPKFPSGQGTWHLSYLGHHKPAGANQPATGGPLLGNAQTSAAAATAQCPASAATGGAVPLTAGQQAKLLPNGDAAAPMSAPDWVKRAIGAANHINRYRYCLGGGHSPYPNRPSAGVECSGGQVGYDCSSSSGYVVAAAGITKYHGQASGDFPSMPGADIGHGGKWLIVKYSSDHVYLVIAGLAFDTGGHPGVSGPRWRPGGVRWGSSATATMTFTAPDNTPTT